MITLSASENAGYFSLNGIDFPKGHYTIVYDNKLEAEAIRNFSLCNIYDNVCILKSRGFAEINEGLSSWSELLQLLNTLGVLQAKTNDTPFELSVNQGKQQGISVVDKFGVNLSIARNSTPEDVWEFGGLYNYDADGTAPIMYLSSSSLNDSVDVSIQGLDVDGYLVNQTITLNGQNIVNLSTALWRVYRMQNEGSVDIEGTVYCHTNPTVSNGVPPDSSVRAIIDNGNNQTLMCLYTIPKGYVGFLYRGEVGVELEGNAAALAEYAHCHYESRRFGKVFKVKKAITIMVSQGYYSDKRSFPDIIPALTDIKVVAVEVSAVMGLWATFDLMLVEEDEFSAEYLQKIGQPT